VTALYERFAGGVIHWITGWFIYPVLVFCGASVLSKRFCTIAAGQAGGPP